METTGFNEEHEPWVFILFSFLFFSFVSFFFFFLFLNLFQVKEVQRWKYTL